MAELRGAINVLLIALGCAVALAASHWLTAEHIRFNETQSLRAELLELVADAAALPRIPPDPSLSPSSWTLCDGSLLGYTEVGGYGGPMKLLFTLLPGADRSLTLHRLRLLSHQETPGLTDFLREEDGWLRKLEGQSAAALEALPAVTGATITSRALQAHLMLALSDPAATLGEPRPVSCGT